MLYHKSIIKHSLVAVCLLFAFSVSAKEQDKKDKISIIENKTGITPSSNSPIQTLYKEAVNWLKTPYRRGGTSAKGMDCSGLTGTIYQNVFGIKLQRSSNDISKMDVKDVKKSELKPGDLVFFSTSRKSNRINHVGVFLGNNHFVHASCSNGVLISSLEEAYYKRTWAKGGKVKGLNEVTPQALQEDDKRLAKATVDPLKRQKLEAPQLPNFENVSLLPNPNVFVK